MPQESDLYAGIKTEEALRLFAGLSTEEAAEVLGLHYV